MDNSNSNNLLSDRPMLIFLATKLNDNFLAHYYASKSCVVSTFRMLPAVAQKCFLYLLYHPTKFF